jgi:penicillin-binding protein 1A
VAVVWLGYDTPRKLGERETGGVLALPMWIDFMSHALRGVPIEEPSAPEGVVNHGGEWFFEEFTQSVGVSSLGLEDKVPEPSTPEEKGSILDIFRR